MLEKFKSKLRLTFDVKLFGAHKNFIGWSIVRNIHGLIVHQSAYAKKLFQKYGLEDANIVRTSLPTNASQQLRPASDNETLLHKAEHSSYRAITGGILYLAVCTRPDLRFSVHALARQMHAPTPIHFRLLKGVSRRDM